MAIPDSHSESDPNGLIKETSPYLLQHAYNPVKWYPWGEDAFEIARKQDKPIFLSIGYSTCYWCHVMERESFEDPEIGSYLEENYIAIKVDREEHPEVDEIYMTATQILNRGRGGWPMSVFLEPDYLKPFYAGTYFPRDDNNGRPGFLKVLTNLNKAWKEQRSEVLDQADRVANSVKFQIEVKSQSSISLDEDVLGKAVSQILDRYDTAEGGFGNAPKFPMPVWLEILEQRSSEEEVQVALDATLNAMARGGIHDHLGGGFHRYSTDNSWTVPHFEKMLYDQGQLASVYAAAYERTGSSLYKKILEDLLNYILREMTHTSGSFYSAQDAEVDTKEGLNYLWMPNEIKNSLVEAGREKDIDFAFAAWGLDKPSNFQDPHHSEEPRRWVLRRDLSIEELAVTFEISIIEVNKKLKELTEILLRVRNTRKQPGLDDKVIAAWNGLMIGGMADGARVLENENFKNAAIKATEDILSRLVDSSGRLLRTARGSKAHINAFLIDHAAIIRGLIRVYKLTLDTRWLQEAFKIANKAKKLFGLPGGGFADVADNRKDLFVRSQSTSDGAMPSGSTLMADSLVELWTLFKSHKSCPQELKDWAFHSVRSLTYKLSQNPSSAALGAQAFDRLVRMRPDLVIESKESSPVLITLKQVSWNTKDEVSLIVEIKIKDGWHINSNKPKNNSLVPTRFIISKGLEMSAEWPDAIEEKGPIGSISIFKGTFDLSLKIKNIENKMFDENAKITLQLQPCTEGWCQRPIQFVLPLKEKTN